MAMERQQTVELLSHVGVVGVGLVDHENPLCQPQQAQGLMLRRQDAEKGLVQRAHPDIGQEGLAPLAGQPGRAFGRRVAVLRRFSAGRRLRRVERQDAFREAFVKAGPAMGEHQGGPGILSEEAPIARGQPAIHGVGGGHGRQGEIEPPGPAGGD